MRTVFLSTLILFAVQFAQPAWSSPAKSETFSVNLGARGHGVMFWKKELVRGKTAHLIGYQKPDGTQVRKVLPKSAYNEDLHDYRKWRSVLLTESAKEAGALCSERVFWTEKNEITPSCTVGLSPKVRRDFTRRLNTQYDKVIGYY